MLLPRGREKKATCPRNQGFKKNEPQKPPPSSAVNATFFISYRGRQVQLAQWVSRLIQSMGFADPWFQKDDFETGTDFLANMERGASKDWCVAVVTEDYFDSKYTRCEWGRAVKADKLLPLCFVPEGSEAEGELHRRLPKDSKNLALTMLGGLPGHLQAARIARAIFQRLTKRAGQDLAKAMTPQEGCATNLPDVRHRFFFKGHGLHLADLKARLAEENAGGQRMVVVRGPAGVGKSWLAEYCGRELACTGGFAAVFILPDASSSERIDEGLAGLSDWLGAAFSPAVMPGVPQRAKAVLNWLRGQSRWLVIADEVNSETSRKALEDRFPIEMAGGVLMVSRQGWTDAMFPNVQLSFLNEEAGAAFLLQRLAIASPSPTQRQVAGRISVEFGGVPEALEWIARQAIRDRLQFHDIPAQMCASWRERLRLEAARVLSAVVQGLSPSARWLLEVLSQTGRHGVPLGVIPRLGLEGAPPDFDCFAARAEIEDAGLCDISDDVIPMAEVSRSHRLVLSVVGADYVDNSLSAEQRCQRRSSLSAGLYSYARSGGDPVDQRSWPHWQELESLLRHLWEGGQP